MKFGTKAVHAGVEPDPSTGAIMTPIFQTSTYVQESPAVHKGFEYSRAQNPTRFALEASLAALENAKFAYAFASGLGAIDAVAKLLLPGDEVVCCDDLYGGSYRIFVRIYAQYGIHFKFVNLSDASELEKHLTDKTKLVWIESPTNPLLKIIDIAEIAKITNAKKILLGVDNTFASPYLQNPLDLGADLVMHSITKYLGGHSDVIMGCLMMNDEKLAEKLKFIQFAVGSVPAPMDCFLVLRGIKTLHLRMREACKNANALALALQNHPKIAKIYYPGLPQHPNHEIAKKQMRDFGAIISFTLKEDTLEAATAFFSKLNIFALAESLGGVESMANHPPSMTHASIPKEERAKLGISESFIRLSVGIEAEEDIVADVLQALN